MKDLTGEQTILAALPLALILVALVAALLVSSGSSFFELRGKAAQPTITPPVITAFPTAAVTPQVGCSDLYQPVCGLDGVTYTSSCAANLAQATVSHTGACATPKTTTTKLQ